VHYAQRHETHAEMSRPIFQLAEARKVGQNAPDEQPKAGLAAQDFFWIVLAGSIAAFVLLVFKPNRQRLQETEAERLLLRAEISQFEERVSHLRSWERSLSAGDREAWSSLARGRLGWLAPGETLLAGSGDDGGRPIRDGFDGDRQTPVRRTHR
jgi:hypothetical protein